MSDIIYIPGFMGNELRVAGKHHPAWTLDQAMVGNIDILDLSTFPADSVYPDKPIQFVYTAHIKQMHHEGFRVHFFAYDWRQPVSSHLQRLHQFISRYCHAVPFQFLCHSTGGLMAALYLDQYEDANCTGYHGFGVPVGGVDYLITVLGNGDPRLKALMPLTDHVRLIRLLRKIPCIYDLLPAEIQSKDCRAFSEEAKLIPEFVQRAEGTRQRLDTAFEKLESAQFPVHFIADTVTEMEVVKCSDSGAISCERGRGDGWIAAHRSHPAWCEPIAVHLSLADMALSGPFGLIAKWLAPHPIQPMFPSVRKTIAECLNSKKG